jgi:hypothetical protein
MPEEPTTWGMALDVASPFGIVKFVEEPSTYNFVTAALAPSMFGAAAFIINRYLVTLANPLTPSAAVANRAHNMQVFLRTTAQYAPVTALLAAEAYMSHELYSGMTKNLGMEPVPHVPGAMTHPFEGGSDSVYYPGKSFVDWVLSW